MKPALVFDTSPLSHFARADALDLLERLTASHRRVAVRAVLDELRNGVAEYPALKPILEAKWLKEVRGDALDELSAYAEYSRRLGSGAHHVGEASTLAWAECHQAVAIIDDRTAVQAARDRHVETRGSLAIVATGVRKGILDEDGACALVDRLARAEAWLPCTGAEFVQWARRNGLL